MVSVGTIIAILVTLCVSVVLPIGVLIWYGVRNKGKGVWTAWLLGAAGFFVMQIIIRLPILNILSLSPDFKLFAENNYVAYCLLLAFTAGLFEVVARYAVAKIMSKNLTFERSIAAGLGHGGIEAILVIGMTYINNIVYVILINTGAFDTVVAQAASTGADVSALAGVKDALINTGSGVFLLAGYERILTMITHVAMTLLVCYFVSKKKSAAGVIICLAIHTVIDFISPVVSGMASDYLGNVITKGTAYAIIYTFLTAVAAGAIALIFVLKKKMEAGYDKEK